MNIKKIIILQLIIMCFLINLFSMPSNAASLDDTLTGADDFVNKGFSTDMDKSQLHSASNYIYNALLGVGIVVAVIVTVFLFGRFCIKPVQYRTQDISIYRIEILFCKPDLIKGRIVLPHYQNNTVGILT